MRKLLLSSRYLIYLPILGSLLASAILFVYGLVGIVKLFMDILSIGLPGPAENKLIAADITKLIDLFLLGAVLYIIAIGLDELFIDEELPVPRWLGIHSLEDLKDKMLATVVVLLVVYFLGYFAEWNGDISILWAGLGVAAVLVPVAYLLTRSRHGNHPENPPEAEEKVD